MIDIEVVLELRAAGSSMIKKALFPFLENNTECDFRNILAIVKKSGIRWIRTA